MAIHDVTSDFREMVTTESSLSSTSNQSNFTTQHSFGNAKNSGDLSKEATDDVIFAIECLTMPILVCCGVIGNILSLIVLSHRKLRHSSTTVLLIGLAVSDTFFLVSTAVRKSTCIISKYDKDLSYRYFVLSFAVMFYVNTCFSRISTVLVAVMSIERFIAVMFPLKVKLFCSKFKMAGTVISVYVFTFAFLILLPIQFKVKYIKDRPFLQYSDFYRDNKEFVDIYNQYITVCVFRWLPKVIVVMCSAIIITLLWKRRIPSENSENISSMSNYSKTQRRVTIMLVTVAVVFVVALLPGDAFLIANMTIDGFELYGEYNNLFMVLSDVTLTFEIINSSINFVIYMVLNSTFSSVYRILFCPCIPSTKRLICINTSRYSAPFSIHHHDQRMSDGSRNASSCGHSTLDVETSQAS